MQGIPQPLPMPLIGNLLPYFQKPIKDVEQELVSKYGSIVGLMEGTLPVLVVSDVEMIDEIFIRNFTTFCDNNTFFYHRIMRQGLITANGDQWRRSRKILGPSFTAFKLRPMAAGIKTCLQHLTSQINNLIQTQQRETDVNDLMGSFMIDVVSGVFLGMDGDAYNQDSVFVQQAKNVVKMSLPKVLTFASLPVFMLEWLQFNITPDDANNYLLELMREIMRQRRGASNRDKQNDLADVLINSQSQDGRGLSQDEILGNMVHFFMAAYETTSGSLSSAIHALAVNPDAQQRLRQDKYESTDKDSYLSAFIQEVLRFYPQAVRFERYATRDVHLNLSGRSVKLEKGSKVRLPIYHMNHDERIFADAHVFDPSRFLPDGVSYGQRIFTFAVGPRNCVGENFARLVMQMTIDHLVKNFWLSPSERTGKELDFSSSTFMLYSRDNYVNFKPLHPLTSRA